MVRVHSYEPRDGLSVCRACGAVENKSAAGSPRWCSGRPPKIDTRDSYERMREDYERLRTAEHERIAGDTRAAGAAEERARIVAMMRDKSRWLHEQGRELGRADHLSAARVLEEMAGRIERGET